MLVDHQHQFSKFDWHLEPFMVVVIVAIVIRRRHCPPPPLPPLPPPPHHHHIIFIFRIVQFNSLFFRRWSKIKREVSYVSQFGIENIKCSLMVWLFMSTHVTRRNRNCTWDWANLQYTLWLVVCGLEIIHFTFLPVICGHDTDIDPFFRQWSVSNP